VRHTLLCTNPTQHSQQSHIAPASVPTPNSACSCCCLLHPGTESQWSEHTDTSSLTAAGTVPRRPGNDKPVRHAISTRTLENHAPPERGRAWTQTDTTRTEPQKNGVPSGDSDDPWASETPALSMCGFDPTNSIKLAIIIPVSARCWPCTCSPADPERKISSSSLLLTDGPDPPLVKFPCCASCASVSSLLTGGRCSGSRLCF